MNATGLLLCLFAMQIQRMSSQDASRNSPISSTHKPSASEGDVGEIRFLLHTQLHLWPTGRIPFTISPAFPSFSRSIIEAAIADFHAYTCIKFVPKELSDADSIDIIPSTGCSSPVGREGGKQPVKLGDNCLSKGGTIHELMHAVGFLHEQSRTDRDDYVKINWQNVYWLGRAQYWKYPITAVSHNGTPYDYDSVMHYDMYEGSWNGFPTIEPLNPRINIGQRKGFSEHDITKINRLYNCDMSNATTTKSPPPSKPILRPCKDKLPYCALLKITGNCGFEKSKQFVQSNCPVSCNLCMADGSAPCMDETRTCVAWAASGSCSNPHFKEIMAEKCIAACNLC